MNNFQGNFFLDIIYFLMLHSEDVIIRILIAVEYYNTL